MNAGDAVMLCVELARLRPLFVEDPIPPDSVMALRAFAAKVGVPVAAGERNTTIWEFAEYLERPGVAYVRPDVGIAGGITHVKKICALAESFHAGVLPHASLGARRGRRARPARDVRTELGGSGAHAPGRATLDRRGRPGDRGARRLPDRARSARPRYRAYRRRPRQVPVPTLAGGAARLSDPPLREDGSVAIR